MHSSSSATIIYHAVSASCYSGTLTSEKFTESGTKTASGILVGRGVFSAGVIVATQAGLTLAGPIGWEISGSIFILSLAAGYIAGTTADQFSQEKSDKLMGY